VSDADETAGADRTRVPLRVALVATLALLVAVRTLPFTAVFRGPDVVLLSNDPYAYVYLVEHALREVSAAGMDPVVGWADEPLLVWTLVLVSALVGGVDRVDLVLAWYPVVTAIVSGLLVFVLARTTTDDVRVALTAVVALAVTPLHVSRTALGFADHHAFDYLWLILTATALVWLLVRTDADRRRRWLGAVVLGVAIAGQTLAWRASPLMLVPTAAAVGLAAPILYRRGDPVRTMVPVVAGFGLAAALTLGVHRTLRWQNAVVAGTPALLCLGGVVLLGVLAGVQRTERSWSALAAAELLVVGGAVAAAWVVTPEFLGEATAQVDGFIAFLERLEGTGIGETASLTAAFGPVIGPLVLLGFAPFLGLPAMAWGLVHGWREREPAWAVLAVYVCWFLGLAFLQRRWAVQLSLFLAVFAGVGFVALAHQLALLRPPVPFRDETPASQETLDPPDRQRLALLAGLGAVGIGGSTVYSGYILSRLTIDDPAYEAAVWMRGHAEQRGWSYPQNYVLAAWGRARMFNYLVNGESRSYAYARETYEAFIFGSDPAEWYAEFDGRVGFIVTRPRAGVGLLNTQARLHDNYGSDGTTVDGVGHYRAMWESAGGEVKVFTPVPGVTVTGTGPAESTLEFATSVTLAGTGRTVDYRRRVETDAEGAFEVVLAHPGEYAITDRATTVAVEEASVREGATVSLQL
jgi:dolichyl-diphosphooligosaccharide--protein glycosyltransferase